MAGTDLALIEAGSGPPVLVLHGELGHPGWLAWHSELAQSHRVLIPLHPGFGRTPRVGWIHSVRDLAGFYLRYLRESGLDRADVIGFSFGGWIAAEMAACNERALQRLVLVAPTGIRPPQGEIMDMFQVTARSYLQASVLDPKGTPEFGELFGGERTPEQFEGWEDAPETARLAWQPYMYNPSLAGLLENVVDLPTLLVWGKQDRVVPISAAEVYRKSIAGSRLVAFDDCGHRPEIEKSEGFVEALLSFLA